MLYFPVLVVHVLAGIVGLLSGSAAMALGKGSPAHVLSGRIFVVSMLIMGAGAVHLGFVKHQPNNVGGGILTVYLITTAWATVRRREGETSLWDWLAALIPAGGAVLGLRDGLEALHSGTGEKYGVPAGMHLFMSTVFLLAFVGDARMLASGGRVGARRIPRHLWRMCFGLFIAAGSFFFGAFNRPRRLLAIAGLDRYVPEALLGTNVYLVLTILPLFLLVFWLVRVRIRGAASISATAHAS